MDDSISRQAAIDALNEVDDGASISTAITVIEGLPSAQPEPQWIPCSERLPSQYERVLVTFINGYVDNITFRTYEATEHIIAWMPLPEPWRGEEHGK